MVITEHGRAVAELIKVFGRPTQEALETIIETVAEDRETLPKVTPEELQRDRESGWR